MKINNLVESKKIQESVEYVTWVQYPDGKWHMWGSNPTAELAPDFLAKAKKQNNIEYKDAKVSKNGEYPEGVEEKDVFDKHRAGASVTEAKNQTHRRYTGPNRRPVGKMKMGETAEVKPEEPTQQLNEVEQNWRYSVGGKEVPYTSYEDAKAHLKDDYNILEYREELMAYLRKEGARYFVDETFDGRLCIDISWGDWKHDHLFVDELVQQFFAEKGLGVKVEKDVTLSDGSDCYSALHMYELDDVHFIGRVVESAETSATEKSVENFLTKYGFTDERYQHTTYTDGNTVVVEFTEGISAKDFGIIERRMKNAKVTLGKPHKDSTDENELWLSIEFAFDMDVNEELDEKTLEEQALSVKDLKAYYSSSTSIDKEQFPNFFVWYDYMVKNGKFKYESMQEAFKPAETGIQSVKCYNQYNYTRQELRVDNDNKTFERGQFTMGKPDKKTKNRQEFEDIVDSLIELGYTEIKSEYKSMRNKSRNGVVQEGASKGSASGFQHEFYNGYIIAKNIAGEGWDIYSYDGTPEKVKSVYLEDEGYATIEGAKEEIDRLHKEAESEVRDAVNAHLDEGIDFDYDDDFDYDMVHTGLYGGDTRYCKDCGAEKAWDEGYSYCPNCNSSSDTSGCYEFVQSKSVPDMDGFTTDYTMYHDTCSDRYVFVFGDADIYGPESGDFDWECDTRAEADEWFSSYNGFEDFDDDCDWCYEGLDSYDQLPKATIFEDTTTEEDEESPVVHKKSDGSYLVKSSSGDGYTAFNSSDVCLGHISSNNDNEAKNKFNSNTFDESILRK